MIPFGLKITAGFDRVECLDEKQEIFAFRFHHTDGMEVFFTENLSIFREKNFSTKVIGLAILVFPKGVK